MSMMVSVDMADAEMLAILKRCAASICQSWDVTLKEQLTLSVKVSCPPTALIPPAVLDAVNAFIVEAIKAARATVDGRAEHG